MQNIQIFSFTDMIYYEKGRGINMEKFCCECNAAFKDDDEMVLDLMNKLAHMNCYEGNEGLILFSGTYKDISENYDKILL